MKKLLAILLLTIPFVSCEKLFLPDVPEASYDEVFESLWTAIDEGYVYFPYKQEIKWDSIYTEYKEKIVDTIEERAFFDTCAQMLAVLEDPNIVLKGNMAEKSYYDPTVFQPNFNRFLMERYYWRNAQRTGPFIHTVIDSTGYVYYGDFSEEINDAQLDVIIEELRLENDSIKGVVFDIRDNPGGDIRNIFTLMRRMGIDTTYTLTAIMYKAFYKDGPEHDNVTEAQTSFIEQSDKTKFPKQFILLTNRRTRAEAALFAAAAQGYINVRVYGDTTGPGTGRIVGTELPNGWTVQYPASYFTTDDDKLLEYGLPPDRAVQMNRQDEDNGTDTILETALKEIEDE